MGIHSESINFEQIDSIKDLKSARMKLDAHSNVIVNSQMFWKKKIFP